MYKRNVQYFSCELVWKIGFHTVVSKTATLQQGRRCGSWYGRASEARKNCRWGFGERCKPPNGVPEIFLRFSLFKVLNIVKWVLWYSKAHFHYNFTFCFLFFRIYIFNIYKKNIIYGKKSGTVETAPTVLGAAPLLKQKMHHYLFFRKWSTVPKKKKFWNIVVKSIRKKYQLMFSTVTSCSQMATNVSRN